MFYDIMIGLSVLAFILLVIFIIQTLIKFQATLKKTNQLITIVQFKIGKIAPLLNSIENAGNIIENKTSQWKTMYFAKQETTQESFDFYGWTLLTISLLNKYLKGGKHE